jgi:CubicO group peptidase (beta-lactamase class C family)
MKTLISNLTERGNIMAIFSYLLFGVLAVWCVYLASGVFASVAYAQATDAKSFAETVEKVRAKHKLPAIGAIVVTSEGVQSIAVAGARKRGDTTPVTNDDLWHLGSNGKAMTATMIARLVERGAMKWEQTLGETFPELGTEMKADIKAVTLSQLLSHRAGFDANFDVARYVDRKEHVAARVDVLKEAMVKGLKHKPGSKFLYSNWGYVVASAMAERASGKPYETLMREEVFTPLKMLSAGFGGTGTVGKIDQPWPHAGDGSAAPSNGPAMDNLPVMAAAGTMHMSLNDWGKFVGEHLRGPQGKSRYLKRETFAKLHTAVSGDYALGWFSVKRAWAGTENDAIALNHGGDNTMNFALVWAAPAKDFAVLITTNQSAANAATDELVGAVLLPWLKK